MTNQPDFTPTFIPVPRKSTRSWTPTAQARFLSHLAATGSVTAAAAAVGLTRASAYQLRAAKGAQSFAAAWDEALNKGIAALKATAFDRALHPQEEPVYHAGQLVGTRPRQNNQLIMRLLTHYDRPETAKDSPLSADLAPYNTPEIQARLEADRLHPATHKLTPAQKQLKAESYAVTQFRHQMTNLALATSLREWLEDDAILHHINRMERSAFANPMVAALIRQAASEGTAPAEQRPAELEPLKALIHAARTEAYAKAGIIRVFGS